MVCCRTTQGNNQTKAFKFSLREAIQNRWIFDGGHTKARWGWFSALIVTTPYVFFSLHNPTYLFGSRKLKNIFDAHSSLHVSYIWPSRSHLSPHICQNWSDSHFCCYAQNKPKILQNLFHDISKNQINPKIAKKKISCIFLCMSESIVNLIAVYQIVENEQQQ